MTGTNHGLFGASIGIVFINYPLVALPLAFASHFLLDALPHSGFDDLGGHLKASKKLFHGSLVIDALLLTISFLVLVANHAPLLVYACWFLAGSPDIAWAYRYIIKEKGGKIKPAKMNWLNRFHSKIQWSQTSKGWLLEIPVMIALFYFVNTNL